MPLPRLPAIDAWLIDDTVKGFPGGKASLPLREIGRQGWNILRQDLPFPVAVLKASALDANRAWMRQFLAATGTVLCPHGKTTMSPQLFQAQIEDGAWGLTCATISQLQVYRRFGIRRVLIANQVVGHRNIAYLLDELARDEDFEPYVLVDSAAGIEMLATAAAARALARPLRLLLEVGLPGLRTGARDMADVRALIAAIEANTPHVALHGVECFEGTIAGDAASVQQRLDALLDFQIEAARAVAASPAASAADPLLVSAGGSEYFDVVADRLARAELGRRTQVVLRSGCYLSHDHLHYARAFERIQQRRLTSSTISGGMRPALEVWGCVQSRPEPGRAYVTGGKRDLSYDMDLPSPALWYRPGLHDAPVSMPAGHRAVAINDQHTHLDVPADSPLAVGDLIGFGISHPCTTFDKWQLLFVVDDAYDVIDAVRTYF
jgi:D-serine dehydratase